MSNPFHFAYRTMAVPYSTSWPAIGMRMTPEGARYAGAEDAVPRGLHTLGWCEQTVVVGAPAPHPDWSISVLDEGYRYRVDWRGERWTEGVGFQPQRWTQILNGMREAVLVYLPTPGDDVGEKELLDALRREECLLLTVPLLGA